MSESKELTVIERVPECAVLVVGSDPIVNAHIANKLRLVMEEDGIATVPLGNYKDNSAYVDYDGIREAYSQYNSDQQSDMIHLAVENAWTTLCRERPNVYYRMQVGIEIIPGAVSMHREIVDNTVIMLEGEDKPFLALNQHRSVKY